MGVWSKRIGNTRYDIEFEDHSRPPNQLIVPDYDAIYLEALNLNKNPEGISKWLNERSFRFREKAANERFKKTVELAEKSGTELWFGDFNENLSMDGMRHKNAIRLAKPGKIKGINNVLRWLSSKRLGPHRGEQYLRDMVAGYKLALIPYLYGLEGRTNLRIGAVYGAAHHSIPEALKTHSQRLERGMASWVKRNKKEMADIGRLKSTPGLFPAALDYLRSREESIARDYYNELGIIACSDPIIKALIKKGQSMINGNKDIFDFESDIAHKMYRAKYSVKLKKWIVKQYDYPYIPSP